MIPKHAQMIAIFVLMGVAFFVSGCASLKGAQAMTTTMTPVVVKTLDVDGQTITAMKLLKTDGAPFAFVFRADEGLIVCPHFDIKSLAQAGIPAARAYNWKRHNFREQLDEPIKGVNALATARGIKVGMTIRQALAQLRKADGNTVR